MRAINGVLCLSSHRIVRLGHFIPPFINRDFKSAIKSFWYILRDS